MILLLIIGTLPLFVIVPIKDYIERLSANTIVVDCALLITGVLLFFSDRYNRGKKNAGSVPLRDVLVIGVARRLQRYLAFPGRAPRCRWDASWALTGALPCAILF